MSRCSSRCHGCGCSAVWSGARRQYFRCNRKVGSRRTRTWSGFAPIYPKLVWEYRASPRWCLGLHVCVKFCIRVKVLKGVVRYFNYFNNCQHSKRNGKRHNGGYLRRGQATIVLGTVQLCMYILCPPFRPLATRWTHHFYQ